MILELGPDASPVARVAAATILYLHVGAGFVALASGTVAAVAKKGARLHRSAGSVFFVSMLLMAAIGGAVSPFLDPPQWTNVIAAAFTLYLVITGYLTGARKAETAPARALMFASAVTIAAGAFAIAMAADNKSDAGPAYVFGVIIALAAFGDLKLLIRGTQQPTQRLGRHLWRMSYAFSVAAGSLFLGQPQVFPESMRGMLFIPVVAALAFMVFWIVRMRFFTRKPAVA